MNAFIVNHMLFAIIIIAIFISAGDTVPAQGIPKDQYLDYLPLTHRKLKPQTKASQKLHLYGDKNSTQYKDTNPTDGIDDTRYKILQEIALKFAPYMVQNTSNVPMDFRSFMEGRSAFPLYVDSWDINQEYAELVKTESIDFVSLGTSECQKGKTKTSSASQTETIDSKIQKDEYNNNDCKLLALLDEFHPDNLREKEFTQSKVAQDTQYFKVLYFDMPGHDPKTWQEAYENQFTKSLKNTYSDFVKTYVHPFIYEVWSNNENKSMGYEFVIQYWFYYPLNDGGNNHEGDWEHINVTISPKNLIERNLTESEMLELIDGKFNKKNNTDDELVIKRVDYYFHHYVMTLDYTDPNVYLSKNKWKTLVKNKEIQRFSEDEIWKKIRYLAYRDEAETEVNTHPFCYIGADNKGWDQILASPGDKNRNSHGTFPFPGLYKDIGPAGASEKISTYIDHKKYFRKVNQTSGEMPERFKRGNVVNLAKENRIKIVPDWERIIDLLKENREARHGWSWMVLPIHYGYPASASPLAGIVKNADTGNVGAIGPSFNDAWNVVGSGQGYHIYEPHQMPEIFPLSFQDSFQNNLGFLNLTYPLLLNLPPLDFAWRFVAFPFRKLFKRNQPVFYAKEKIPFRFFGVSTGYSTQKFHEDYEGLMLNAEQFNEFIVQFLFHLILNRADSTTIATNTIDLSEDAFYPILQIVFYIGDRFASENTIRNSRSKIGAKVEFNNIPPYEYTSELNYWEFSGSLRYSLTTKNIQPFLKLGYGWSWYRLEDAKANGEPFSTPNSPWLGNKNILPNTFHLGAGFEYIVIKSFGQFPSGIDLSIRAEYALSTEKLDLDLSSIPLENLRLLFPTLNDIPNQGTVTRHNVLLGLTLSF